MIQNKLVFLLFSLLVIAAIRICNTARSRAIIVFCSNFLFLMLVFFWQQKLLAYLVALIIINFILLKVIIKSNRQSKNIITSLTILFNFIAFALLSYPSLTDLIIGYTSKPLVIVGFGFLFLRILHVIFESNLAHQQQRLSLVGYLNYLLYFPCYFTGPILRYDSFMQQSTKLPASKISDQDVYDSVARMIIGLFKLQVLAYLLSFYSANNLSAAAMGRMNIYLKMFSIYTYGLWLYFSFSGANDFSIGISKLMGIQLPENFNKPILAMNLQDFWQRWHITLLEWIRDYVYFPCLTLLNSIAPSWPLSCTLVTILATFIALGIWHGAGLGFLCYGLYHGLGMCIFFLYRYFLSAKVQQLTEHSRYSQIALKIFSWIITWNFISISWLLFIGKMDVFLQLI